MCTIERISSHCTMRRPSGQWAMIYIGHKFTHPAHMGLIEKICLCGQDESVTHCAFVGNDKMKCKYRANKLRTPRVRWSHSFEWPDSRHHIYLTFIEFCEWTIFSVVSPSLIGRSGRVCRTSETTRHCTENRSGILAMDTVRTTSTISDVVLASTEFLPNANHVIVVDYQFPSIFINIFVADVDTTFTTLKYDISGEVVLNRYRHLYERFIVFRTNFEKNNVANSLNTFPLPENICIRNQYSDLNFKFTVIENVGRNNHVPLHIVQFMI